ncbi:alpha/beta fold hydrolase [Actinomadura sp. HBU206391]|uniref:alpha/beta fold hydrolase n=1 Tax=Actinomadura sp. HBU206391 TaxID=2731692 RepID=UPI002905C6DE|nr:alpha/beta fold hydrolase [Actinomadura sp. HBU206391]
MTLNHRFDGPGDAPVLVLGPSLGTTMDLWAPQLPLFTRTWRVLRYDLPGHGGSAAPAASGPDGAGPGVTMEGLAAEVVALLDLHGLDRVAYCGLSIGGAVGTTLAVTAPERIGSLVLCCTSARFGPPESWHERASLVRREGTEPLVESTRGRWFTPDFADPEPQLAMLRAVDREGYAACCEAIAGFDARDRLGEVTAPTLIIAGAGDPATPVEHAKLLLDGISGAALCVVSPAAHLANVESPEVVGEAIAEHLTATWPPSGGGARES